MQLPCCRVLEIYAFDLWKSTTVLEILRDHHSLEYCLHIFREHLT